jgi:hypothetical protein
MNTAGAHEDGEDRAKTSQSPTVNALETYRPQALVFLNSPELIVLTHSEDRRYRLIHNTEFTTQTSVDSYLTIHYRNTLKTRTAVALIGLRGTSPQHGSRYALQHGF